MGHWNHRVVRKVFHKGTENEEEQYSIREVFYNDAGEIFAFTENPIGLACETPEALREYIQWCLQALDKPILEEDGFVFAKDDYEINEDEIRSELKGELSKEQIDAIILDIRKDMNS